MTSQEQGTTSCRHCGAGIATGALYCPQCGTARPIDDQGTSEDAGALATQPSLNTAETGSPRPSRNRRPLVLGGLVAVVILVTAGILIAVLGSGSRHTIKGVIELDSAFGPSDLAGTGCTGQGGYDDIVDGAPVTIMDGSGAKIALGHLKGGVFLNGDDSKCYFTFTVKGVPDAAIYEVTAGNNSRQGPSYSKSDLQQNGWEVSLTLS